MGSPQKTNSKDKPLKEKTILQSTYIITRLIRESAASRMYVGEDINTKKKLAIKELLMDKFTNPAEKKQALEQFHLEAKILLRLKHPNLSVFEDYFEHNGRRYLIMEYINGVKLNIITESKEGFLEEEQVVNWGIELSEVLEYLHSRKPSPIIFRDLCPENVILSEEGTLKLIDFGISKLFDPKSRTLAVAKTANVHFSPMEQYIAQTDERTDIYSLGATLYFLSTKELPVDALDRTFNGLSLPPCKDFNHHISPELEEVILKAMNLEQKDRYDTIASMKKALEEALMSSKKSFIQKMESPSPDKKSSPKEPESHLFSKENLDVKEKKKKAEDKVCEDRKESSETAGETVSKPGFIERAVTLLIDFLEGFRKNIQNKKK